MILYYILVPFAWILWHIGFRIRVEGRENLKKVQTKGQEGTVRDQRLPDMVLPVLRRGVRARHKG